MLCSLVDGFIILEDIKVQSTLMPTTPALSNVYIKTHNNNNMHDYTHTGQYWLKKMEELQKEKQDQIHESIKIMIQIYK